MSNNNTLSIDQDFLPPQPPTDEPLEQPQELNITAFRDYAAKYPDQLFHQMIQLQQQNELFQTKHDIVQTPNSLSNEYFEMISELQNLQSTVAPLHSLANKLSQLLASIEATLSKAIPSSSPISSIPCEGALVNVPKTSSAASTSSSMTSSNSSNLKLAGTFINVSQAMAAVKGRSLKRPGVREVCNTWNLCYYCKLSHPGKTAINCPNKGEKSTNRRA